MTRARRKHRAPAREPVGDFGPLHQRDGTRDQPGLRRVVVEDAFDAGEGADPNRIIRRARVADPLRRMVAAGMPYRCWLAAERLREDIEAAQAKRGVKSQLRPGLRVGPPAGYDMPVGALAAAARVRRAWQVIGLADAGVISWCVVPKLDEGGGPLFGTLTDYARCKAIRKERASEALVSALHRLANHYGYGNPEAPRGFAGTR